jgi:hypothetical protein
VDSSAIVVWISGVGTVIAAAAACFAALYTKRAAGEAAKAAKAAADQVELQRPRPIVVATFLRSFSPNKGNMAADDKDLRLENIGDSPAFDVEVSNLEVPGSRLLTETFPYLQPGSSMVCNHKLEPGRGLSGVMGRAALFVEDAKTYFNEQSMNESSRSANFRYEIPFSISYRTVDLRQFKQSYVFVVYFPLLRAWVEPVGSLLPPPS